MKYKDILNAIYITMGKKGMSRNVLSKKADIPRNTIINYLEMRTAMPLDRLLRILNALDLEIRIVRKKVEE